MVHHQLAQSEFNTRRSECEQGVAAIRTRYPDVKALRDVTIDMLQVCVGNLSDSVFRRCRHVVSENQRVQDAKWALQGGNVEALGRLMWASHRSLRDDYEVSCRELDNLVEIAMASNGVYGGRMMGGGFGGCTVNLVASPAVDAFREHVLSEYKAATGQVPEVYVSGAVQGAALLK
jgi:galactokinase